MAETFTIGEAAERLGLSPSALRYYDRNGLLPKVGRSQGGVRQFTEDDLEWVRMVEWLKMAGMPLKEVKHFIDLIQQGDSTIEERRRIVHERKAIVEKQLEDMQSTFDFISYKCWYYDVAAEAGTYEAPSSIPVDELPPEIRRIKEHCDLHN
ncbi:MAG: MerR family transcriptional regulator [Coriobacteriales bacterium]|jgi:DNA-binding transcriptional MerR regulator